MPLRTEETLLTTARLTVSLSLRFGLVVRAVEDRRATDGRRIQSRHPVFARRGARKFKQSAGAFPPKVPPRKRKDGATQESVAAIVVVVDIFLRATSLTDSLIR
jgi:hypothetical protein